MRRQALIVSTLATLLLVAGCSSTPTTETAPDPGCLQLSDGATTALQGGLDGKGVGYTINTTAAVLDDDGDGWWVAADLAGDPDVEAVWYTTNDPTVDADNAYLSATELASLVSIYLMPEDLTGADPINAAIDCLG